MQRSGGSGESEILQKAMSCAVETTAQRQATSALKSSLLHSGDKSVFWQANQLPPRSAAPAEKKPMWDLTHEHPGNSKGDHTKEHPDNSKALAIFWDLDRFNVAGGHEQCTYAVDAVRCFCKRFVGPLDTRDVLEIKGYCRGVSGLQSLPHVDSDAKSIEPQNAGCRATSRGARDDAGLKDLVISKFLPSFSVVDKDPFAAEGQSSAAGRESPQMLIDLLVWMLDCTQRRLFVPTAVVIR